MNTIDNTTRPLGFWLRTVDHLIRREFAGVTAREDLDHRAWRTLRIVGSERLTPEIAERISPRDGFAPLQERGWITQTGDTWNLTDSGREVTSRMRAAVSDIRARISGAVPAEALATTTASLEQIAQALGFDPSAPRRPHGRRHHRHNGCGARRDARAS